METTVCASSDPESDSWQFISSGIDWLTCSQRRSDEQSALWRNASKLLEREEAAGNRVKPWKLRNVTGLICGQTVRAMSPTHIVAQLSGAAAQENAMSLLPFADHVSRLDLQVTAMFTGEGTRAVAQAAYGAQERRRRGGAPLTRTLLNSQAGGATCYLGSRSSDVYGRVYDKGVESGQAPAGKLWRWEVEMKRDVATLTACELVAVECAAIAAAGRCSWQMSEWGTPLPLSLPAAPIFRPQTREPDSARILRWLSQGVRPSVEYLCGIGLRDEVTRALGLPAPPTDSKP